MNHVKGIEHLFKKIFSVLKNVRRDILEIIAAKCVHIQHLEKGVFISVLVRNTSVTSCMGAQMASIHLFYTVLTMNLLF